jgi:hypothetical protein
MRNFVCIGCLVACCVVVPLALILPSAQSQTMQFPSLQRMLDVEHVVTDLRVHQATTFLAATTTCQAESGWVAVGPFETGSNWHNGDGNGDRFVQFCVQRSRIQDPSVTEVLQRIEVVKNVTECPPSLDKLYSPRDNVVVCVSFASSKQMESLLASGSYINNIAVTKERNYNNGIPGWLTLPVSVHDAQAIEEEASRGVFISYQRPVTPITALEVITDVEASNTSVVCVERFGLSWESAGMGYLDQASNSTKTVLCTERKIEALALRQLTDVHVIRASGSCPTGFSERQTLSNTYDLCLQWGNYRLPQSDIEHVADLLLLRVTANDRDALAGQKSIPGDFVAASGDYDLNLVSDNTTVSRNATMASLYLRKTPSFASSSAGNAQASSTKKPPLRAKTNGSSGLSFKVLQIADMHYTGNPDTPCSDAPPTMTSCTEQVMTQFIGELLDLEKPDFVVFSGDNVQVSDSDLRRTAMDTAVSGAESRRIPFAMVLGNHDDEQGFLREDIIAIAESYNYSYTSRGPTSVDGFGNYELAVQVPESGAWGKANSDIFRMYFLDSHSYPNTTAHQDTNSKYDWVKQSQIDYLKRLSTSNQVYKVPSVMFFHIPIPEYAATTPNTTTGQQNEGVSSSEVNSNLFSALVEQNEVKATFVGHDHVNEFCSHRDGIALCYGGGVGFGAAYGLASFARRARVIEWSMDSANMRTIRSWKRHYADLSVRHNEEILYTETMSSEQ